MITSWSLPLTVITVVVLIASTTADAQLSDRPIIIPKLKEITLQSGQNFTLRCVANRKVQFKQQEEPEQSPGQFYTEQREVSLIEDNYEVELKLYYVDKFAVGYYACFDDNLDSGNVLALNEISEEPNNTEHISYIYIYVNDSLNMFAPMSSFILVRSNSLFLIDCRPTSPDIKVELKLDLAEIDVVRYNPKLGFTFDGRLIELDHLQPSVFTCEFRRNGKFESSTLIVTQYKKSSPCPQPTISGGLKYFLKGESFSLNCTVIVQMNHPVALMWKIPGHISKVRNTSNEYTYTDILYSHYTITNASKDDAGDYECISKNSNNFKFAVMRKEYLEYPVINMTKQISSLNSHGDVMEIQGQKLMRLKVKIVEYPPTVIEVFKDDEFLPEGKHNNFTIIINHSDSGVATVSITKTNIRVSDTANYTVVASNQYLRGSVSFDVRVVGPPVVDFGPPHDIHYESGTIISLQCEAIGYPLPRIRWVYTHSGGYQEFKGKQTVDSLYKVKSTVELKKILSPGNLTCEASNGNKSSASRKVIVYEMPNGFGIENSNGTWYSEGENVLFICKASIHDFTNVTWYRPDYEPIQQDNGVTVEHTSNTNSYIAKLRIIDVNVDQGGAYMCSGLRNDESEENQTIIIDVESKVKPKISDPEEVIEQVLPFQSINYTCTADAVPPPKIEWYKDGLLLENDTNIVIFFSTLSPKIRQSVLKIIQIEEADVGKYECRVTSDGVVESKMFDVQIKEKSTLKAHYLIAIGVIFLALIILVIYLAWKIRKEKQFRKELAAAGLLYFKEGVTKSLNPDLGIDEQAELLPYDERFEFPADKLKLGKQLGAGAFGVVYKAEARGIVNAEETTTVAVKMVKKTADNMYIKALASELKIMVHLGKHVNIVNLLGACTKHVGKRELSVIVEYCRYGNIHNYMQKHREVFIDQLTDNAEKNLGKDNRGYCSSGNSGMHSDYFGSNHTQNTDNTFLNTANTSRSERKENPKQVENSKVSETGYVQPEWRSNYECDYSFDGRSPRPLYSRDLLIWAFQIARGMEYLASRKVLHGDLAARNILLADDNVVKICDFGLARSIYKNDEYQKKENSPLPVKWLAIECMTDRIFSTQSDVWSFGIVLWELFSLAKTPYPNVSPTNLLQWLSADNRLEKPPYADNKLYDLMMQCWRQKPTTRPTFSELQLILGTFLEENDRDRYIDLNTSYIDINTQREGEDYLAMVTAPDYNNMVTPSPHIYVNDARSFFPLTPQLQHDDEGYLQMSPASRQTKFNARAQGTKFDFDARKLSPRESDANSCGSELTPMLTLNNLPRSGSESDHENNSLYLNMCPRIDEVDEVFLDTKQNNAKNTQPSAVTNPTYITFSSDGEKIENKFANNYINVNVPKPNGLVK